MPSEETRAVTVRLPRDHADMLEEMARVDGVSIAEEVRTAVAELIGTRRRDKEFRRRLKDSFDRNRRILELFELSDAEIRATRG